MSTEILDYNAVLTQLPAGGSLIIRDVSWEDYEALLEAAGESPGLRISYDCGTLQIMTVSS